MKTVFDELMSGLDDVDSFLAGQKEGFKLHVPEDVDVKTIRKSLNMTQSCFSDTFGFTLDSVKNWEIGRRKPEASARTLLTVIEKAPAAVLYALNAIPSPGAIGTINACRISGTRKDRYNRGSAKSKNKRKASDHGARPTL